MSNNIVCEKELKEKLIEKMWKSDDKKFLEYLNNPDNTKYGLAKYFFHTHTDYGSPKDSMLTIRTYVSKAKDMGAKAIAISDHGTMYAVPLLYDECEKKSLKLVIGVEFYVCDTIEDKHRKKHTRFHLCAYAKNMIGYHVIARLITESNNRMIVIHTQDGDLTYPCISKKLLETYLGPGTEGHGNVILTSACVGGVITGYSYANETLKANIQDLEKKLNQQKESLEKVKFADQALEKAESEKAVLMEISKKTYTKRKNALKRHPNPEEEHQIMLEEAETQQATIKLKELNDVIRQAKKMKTENQKQIDQLTKIKYCDEPMLQELMKRDMQELQQLKSEVVPEHELIRKFEEEALWYDQLAGHGNWYIELQYHHISTEKKYMPYLVKIAKKHNIPLLAANDAHMADKEDAIIRKYVNSLRFNKWEPLADGDEEMYLKDDVSLYQILASCVGANAAWEAMKNREMLAENCNVRFEKEEHYPKYIA